VGFEVALVGGDAIGAIEYSEKIRQQVDQHSTGKRPAGKPAQSPSATGAPNCGRNGRGMIAVTDEPNKRSFDDGSSFARVVRIATSDEDTAGWRRSSRVASRAGTKFSFVTGGRNVRGSGWGDTGS
jgi:hypothetical protein